MKKWAAVTAPGILIVLSGCTKIQSSQDVPRSSKEDGLALEIPTPPEGKNAQFQPHIQGPLGRVK